MKKKLSDFEFPKGHALKVGDKVYSLLEGLSTVSKVGSSSHLYPYRLDNENYYYGKSFKLNNNDPNIALYKPSVESFLNGETPKPRVILINGPAGAGKDEVAKMIRFIHPLTDNHSSVGRIKKFMSAMGWDGVSKTERDRKMMSDLKLLFKDYSNESVDFAVTWAEDFENHPADLLLVYHVRETEEIQEIKDILESKGIEAISLFIKRPGLETFDNEGDKATLVPYKYEYTIDNNGTLSDLKLKVAEFMAHYFGY